MRHKVKKTQLNLPKGKQVLLLNNLATSIVLNEKVKTTHARAKAVQPLVEKLINVSKKTNKVNAIREVNKYMQSEIGAKKLIKELSQRYQSRESGYTRITKLGFRAGDAAPLVQIELVA